MRNDINTFINLGSFENFTILQSTRLFSLTPHGTPRGKSIPYGHMPSFGMRCGGSFYVKEKDMGGG